MTWECSRKTCSFCYKYVLSGFCLNIFVMILHASLRNTRRESCCVIASPSQSGFHEKKHCRAPDKDEVAAKEPRWTRWLLELHSEISERALRIVYVTPVVGTRATLYTRSLRLFMVRELEDECCQRDAADSQSTAPRWGAYVGLSSWSSLHILLV